MNVVTLYPDVNQLLERLRADLIATLGEQLVGLYLHGSLATGSFTPGRSDIDFLVVTATELSDAQRAALIRMHAAITHSGLAWADRLEGSYIPRAALRRYDPQRAHHLALRMDGSFAIDHHASDWIIQRHVIREQGITLAGPPPADLIDPVAPDDLRRAQIGILNEWWRPQLTDQHRLVSDEYQAYAILTMCRALYTLHHGRIATKQTAADWVAQSDLGQPWTALIERALTWRLGITLDALPETLDLIRATLAYSEQYVT
jgi:hypothetical protein